MATDRAVLVQALDPLREMLAADGYALRCTASDTSVLINIDATADACAECLAPADTIEMIVIDQLERVGVDVTDLLVQVVLPEAQH